MKKKRNWWVWALSMLVLCAGFMVMPDGSMFREVSASVLIGIAYDLRLRSGSQSIFDAMSQEQT